MFSRNDLFAVRAKVSEAFHAATNDEARRQALDLLLRINERLLRRDRQRLARPGWAEAT